MGISITHVYGLTEVYGPAVVCAEKPEWRDLPLEERARLKARQGVAYELQEDVLVLDPETGAPVPWDGETQGEIVFRGNIVMKGYLKQPDETAKRSATAGSGRAIWRCSTRRLRRDPRPRQGHHHFRR